MADEPKPDALASRNSSSVPDLLDPISANQLSHIDVDKLKLLFDLQEKQREKEFKRQLELLERQERLREQRLTSTGRDRTLTTRQEVQKLELYFKMFVTAAALTIGTIFVLTGHENVGFFLLGGALSTVTSGVVGLMKASRF